MRIIRPISAHDANLLDQAVALMQHFGGLESHYLVLAPSKSTRDAAQAAAETLRPLCQDVTVLPLDFEGQDTWPQSPNRQWVLTIEAVRKFQPGLPMFWMELDCDPCKPNWATLLEQAWKMGRTASCGKLVPVTETLASGEVAVVPNDLMMMGCAIYSPSLTGLPNWSILTKGLHTGTNPEPFDRFLRGALCKAGWTNTNLIGDRWNTVNYRMEDGRMVCDNGPQRANATDHSQTDISEAVVVHGCKDGSFGRLTLGKPIFSVEVITKTPEAANPVWEPVAVPTCRNALVEIDALAKRVEALEARFGPPKDEIAEVLESPPVADAIIQEDEPLLPTLRGLLADKGHRLKNLAKVLGIDRQKLRAIIARPDSGIFITPNGYATLKT